MDARDAGEVLADAREHGAKYIALLIAALAALLAVVEMTGGNAEQDALKANVDASNLWAFYQAKTIRQTTLRTEAERLELDMASMPPPQAEAARKALEAWRATIDRYESEPATNEGRKELMSRASAAEQVRDHALAVDNMLDIASAALQLAIVLASASVVIGIAWLAWTGGALGLVGLVFALLGWVAPTLIRL
jgi:hypothetical protein